MDKLKKSGHFLWKKARNPYLIISLLFIALLGFLSPNTVSVQYKLYKEFKGLQQMQTYYETEIEKNKQQIKLFKTDLKHVETFGREEHLMKRDNEDIFLIVETRE